MRNRPSNNFKYTDDTENLFLFYQCINEMTFDFSLDTYKAPILDVKLLCKEANLVFESLCKSGMINKYYHKYLTPILEELKNNILNDNVAKKILGGRYEKILKELDNLKEKEELFGSTIRNLINYFGGRKYYNEIVNQLIDAITGTKEQSKIIYLSGNWVTELLDLGYSKQHIYNMTQNFFDNIQIDTSSCIRDFFKIFSFQKKKWELFAIIDKKLMTYINGLGQVIENQEVEFEKISDAEIKELLLSNEYKSLNWFWQHYNALKIMENVEIVKCYVNDLDPYCATKKMRYHIGILMNIMSNFDNKGKHLYDHTICINYTKQSIKVQSAMERRNRKYGQSYLTNAIKMLRSLKMSQDMLDSLMKVLSYHGDALVQGLGDKYVIIMLWTSLETLFVGKSNNVSKGESVKRALLDIIQRTYVIKRLKYLHSDFIENIKATNKILIYEYDLDNFSVFVEMLFDSSNSERMKKIQETLAKNPLLRTRIFDLVEKSLKDGKTIKEMLDQHKKKIDFQIERIYRVRNFLVHAGEEFWFEDSIVECLHNYVDFVINYIIVKSEAGEYIMDINDLVEEAKSDNEIHYHILNQLKNEHISELNYKKMLFGPSTNILEYYNNHIV